MLFCLCAFVFGNFIDQAEEYEKLKHLLAYADKDTTDNVGFSIQDCGKDTDPVKIDTSSVKVSPDPIEIPGKVDFSGSLVISKEIANITKLELVVKRKLFGIWIKLPCIGNLGSCTFKDICPKLEKLIPTCPEELKKHGINCRCPAEPNKYSISNMIFPIPSNIPAEVTSGSYEVKATLTDTNGEVMCYQITASVKRD